MREVAVIGVGMIKMGKFPDRLLSNMGREAVLLAMKHARVGREKIQVGACGTLHGGSLLGRRIFKDLGEWDGNAHLQYGKCLFQWFKRLAGMLAGNSQRAL